MDTNQYPDVNTLRKKGKYEEALDIYRNNWNEKEDKYTGAGLLHCLRKTKQYEEALLLSETLVEKFIDFNWVKIEVIWTYIEGRLLLIDETNKFDQTIDIANRILELGPEQIALEKVVFRVLKMAKQSNRWDIISEWINKLNPDFLSNEPIMTERGSIGWSKFSLWYNYKANALIKTEKYQEVLEILEQVEGKVPKQQERLFHRLRAVALRMSGNLAGAEKIYKKLCEDNRTDWWLIHEYAKTKRDMGNLDNALELMYKAASKGRKLSNMVSLVTDIGYVSIQLDRKKVAYYHLLLAKQIREKNGWNIDNKLIDNISKLSKHVNLANDNLPFSMVLKECENNWNSEIKKDSIKMKGKRKGLEGSLLLGKETAPFCFIKTEEESFYCLKVDIVEKSGLRNGLNVKFDAIPSFDKKKNKESWKAINIREK